MTVHRDKFLIIKPTRCTNFSNLFLKWNSACFGQILCPSSGIFHYTHSDGICLTGLLTACKQDQDGTQFRVEFHFKNKFEKLVHLVGFIIRNVWPCWRHCSCYHLVPWSKRPSEDANDHWSRQEIPVFFLNLRFMGAFAETLPKPYESSSYPLTLFHLRSIWIYFPRKWTGLSSRFPQPDNRQMLPSVLYRSGPQRESPSEKPGSYPVWIHPLWD